MSAAKKRAASTVALDLSLADQVAAVAVDGRGALVAWTVVSEEGGPVALARQALRELQARSKSMRPRDVRVLLGSGTGAEDEAQVAVLDHPGTPGEGEILAALYADGYPRLIEPSVAALATAPGTWLVAACGAATVEPLAAALLEESGTEPAFTVDQLLENGNSGAPQCRDAPWGVSEAERALPLPQSARGAFEEHGPSRRPGDAPRGVSTLKNPSNPSPDLPAACALAWRLASCPAVTRLAGPRSERRRASLAWARRATHAALVLSMLGVLAMAAGLMLGWAVRARNRALASQAAGDVRLVKELREIAALAEEAKRLRADLTGRTAPWPRLAEEIAALARTAPPETGWEKLQIKEGALELEASAAAGAGAEPEARLMLLRQALQRSPGLTNLAWGPPAADPQSTRLRQVFRAAVREAP